MESHNLELVALKDRYQQQSEQLENAETQCAAVKEALAEHYGVSATNIVVVSIADFSIHKLAWQHDPSSPALPHTKALQSLRGSALRSLVTPLTAMPCVPSP